ncbi:MAG: hypothetical protein MJ131_04175 [Lachnospiraceae bacterium]|nr:hypothetical protein [Lachnospiraceae bacterium]
MLNNRKIRLMTKLAIYEQSKGKEDIKLAKYYKSDYARLQVLKTAIAVTISYLCLIAIGVIYKMQYLLDNALDINYPALGKKLLGIYLAIMAVYLIFTALGYSLYYTASRKKLARYFRMLRKLNHMYLVEDGYVRETEEDEEYEEEEEEESRIVESDRNEAEDDDDDYYDDEQEDEDE